MPDLCFEIDELIDLGVGLGDVVRLFIVLPARCGDVGRGVEGDGIQRIGDVDEVRTRGEWEELAIEVFDPDGTARRGPNEKDLIGEPIPLDERCFPRPAR